MLTPNGNPHSPLPSRLFANRQRRARMVADELHRLVVEGTFPIGSKLPTEGELCERFEVSRNTLREAIQMLRSVGLLDVTPGRGSFVRLPSLAMLLPSLQLIGQSHVQGQACSAQPLVGLLVLHAVTSLQGQHLRSREDLQKLYQLTLVRNGQVENNLQLEIEWQKSLLRLAGQPLLTFMGEFVLGIYSGERLRAFVADRDGRLTYDVIQLQLRVNAALMENDVALAVRCLTPWYGLHKAGEMSVRAA